MNAVESGAAAVSRLLQLIAPEPERLDEDAVLEAVQEAEDEALVFECDPRWLLQVAARELSGYGLALWRWQGDNPDLCLGFVCREEDGDLLLQCATALEARLLRVEDEDWPEDG